MITTTTKLVLPRGKLYFNRFPLGTRAGPGERYIGNTPQVSILHTKREIERAASYRGKVFAQPGYVAQESYGLSFSTDNVDFRNVMLWMGADSEFVLQEAAVDVTEEIVVERGYHYQLGRSDANPVGRRGIGLITVAVDGDTVDADDNYTLDARAGLLGILDDAPDIADGDTLTVTYELRDATSRLARPSSALIHGSLRYVAENPIGDSDDYFFPMVAIKPSGEAIMKSDDWQQWSYSADAMKISANRELVYIMRPDEILYTIEEKYITAVEGVALRDFVVLDNILNQVVNKQLPSRDY